MSTMSPWDPISPGSSRRSSEAGAGAGARMSPVVSHHLTKLHKKALAAGTNSSLAQVTIKFSLHNLDQFLVVRVPSNEMPARC